MLLEDGGHPKVGKHLFDHPQVRKLGHRPCLISIVPSHMAPIALQLPLAGVPALATQSRGPRAQRVGAGSVLSRPHPLTSAGAGRRETKGPAIAGPSWPQPWQPSPASHWPPVTAHGPLGSPGPWHPLWHPLLPAWPPTCPHAPFIRLSACSPSVLHPAALGQGEDKEEEEEKGGCPSA